MVGLDILARDLCVEHAGWSASLTPDHAQRVFGSDDAAQPFVTSPTVGGDRS